MKEGVRMKKENVLISACLLGINCRYDGGNNYIAAVEELKETYNLIPVCAEIYGGLTTPRIPAERLGDGVVFKDGSDATKNFVRGAEEILKLAKFYDCKLAILKERSPSCGSGMIYDGTFTGTLTAGDGVLCELLKKNGIRVVGESKFIQTKVE